MRDLVGPSVHKIFRDDFFTRMGPFVAEIFRGDFSPLCSRYSGMTFSPEWDHLCQRYLGVIFHWSGTICDQNVRFYLEATIIVERLFCQFIVFPRFLICLLLLTYIFHLFFACLSVFTHVGPFSPKIFRDDLFMRMGPSVPEILRVDFSPRRDHLCPGFLWMIFSGEWDHLCPTYLGVIFHSSGTICNQNGRFYLEATIIEERLSCQFLVFPRFLFCLLLLFCFIFHFTCYFFCLLVSFHLHGTMCAQDI